jgi:hypothetical protein
MNSAFLQKRNTGVVMKKIAVDPARQVVVVTVSATTCPLTPEILAFLG